MPKKILHIFEVCIGLMYTLLSLCFPKAKKDTQRKECDPFFEDLENRQNYKGCFTSKTNFAHSHAPL